MLVKPGYMVKYSGGGYSVVQQLLIDVTGTPFPEYMQQQVLEPLGMDAQHVRTTAARANAAVGGHGASRARQAH